MEKRKILDNIKRALGIEMPEEESCEYIFDHEPVWDGQMYSCWKCSLEFKSTGKYLFKLSNSKVSDDTKPDTSNEGVDSN